jgi:hypothetical protein
MLVLLQVVGLPTMSTAPSAAFLISMILIIVAQAYCWLCSGWVLAVLWKRVSSQRPNGPPPTNFGYDHTWRAPGTHRRERSIESSRLACHIARRRKSPYSRHYGVSPLLHVAARVTGVANC